MDTPLPPSDQPNTPKPRFDGDAFSRIGNDNKLALAFQIINDLADTIGKQDARIRQLELYRSNPNEPVRNLHFDPEFFNVARMGDNMTIGFDEDAMRAANPPLPPVGDSSLALPDCLNTWLMYDLKCVTRPGLAPLMIKFEINAQTCNLRARTFDLCCVTCDGESGSYQSGSGSYTQPLDQWAGPCSEAGSGSANDGTNFVYLPEYIFDTLNETYDDPIIQLDGEGLCYQLVKRDVLAIETTFTTFTFFETCDDSDCEDEVPCVSCPGDNYASGLKISGFADTDYFGTLQSDVGGGCTNGGATSGFASWNGTFATWSASDCSYELDGNYSMTIGGGAAVSLGGGDTEVKWVNPGGGAACYWRVRISFSLNATTSYIEYRKTYGDTPIGTYTFNSTDPATLESCSTNLKQTISIVSA